MKEHEMSLLFSWHTSNRSKKSCEMRICVSILAHVSQNKDYFATGRVWSSSWSESLYIIHTCIFVVKHCKTRILSLLKGDILSASEQVTLDVFCIINDKRDDSSDAIISESIMWFLWHASLSSFIDERWMYSDGQEELYATIGKTLYLKLHIKVGYSYYHNN